MISWESILPKKYPDDRVLGVKERDFIIDDCLEALKAAEARGEICKPLSVEDVINLACKFCKEPCDDIKARCWDKAREVHKAMLNREG